MSRFRESNCILFSNIRADRVRYISHIGAERLKPLFVAGSVVTGVFMTLSLLSERWLRHAGQLARNKDLFDKSCAIGSIFFALTGALGVILLSIFDTKHHQHLHYGFLAMFMYDHSSRTPKVKRPRKANQFTVRATYFAPFWSVLNTSTWVDGTTPKPESCSSASISRLYSSSASLASQLDSGCARNPARKRGGMQVPFWNGVCYVHT